MKKLLFVLGALGSVLAGIALLAVIFSFPIMWLWNWIMPTIFGLTKITVVQAWGVNFLCGILFKGTTTQTKSN